MSIPDRTRPQAFLGAWRMVRNADTPDPLAALARYASTPPSIPVMIMVALGDGALVDEIMHGYHSPEARAIATAAAASELGSGDPVTAWDRASAAIGASEVVA